MKKKIMEIFNSPKARTLKGVCDLLNTKDRKMVLLTLEELIKEGYIIKIDNRYGKSDGFKLFKGVISVKDGAYGFVNLTDRSNDVFVPGNALNGAFDGDTVLVTMKTNMHRGELKFEGEVKQIVERKAQFVIGTFKRENFEVISDSIKDFFRVFISPSKTMNAQTGHKVRARIVSYANEQVIAEIDMILGHETDPGMDILSIIYRYEIPYDFSDKCLEEVSTVPLEIKDIKGRKDLRSEIIVTIDGEDAKDFDDAISLRKLNSGNYQLGVHIADVSYYVKENSPLDIDAYNRGTSIYLADRVVPMLPHALSNGICSLNPDVDRYTLSCEMEIDGLGNVVKHEIYPSVINSHARMTYTLVNKILKKETKHKYEELFILMEECAKVLSIKRHNEGAIDFNTDELKIIVDKKGFPTDIQIRKTGVSENIIEEFMLLANQVVARHFNNLKLPFIYRIHEEPDMEKLNNVIRLIRSLGERADVKGEVKQADLQRILFALKGSNLEGALNSLLLRSMMKARYSEACLGHYGLSFNHYTHFTSPIRRYPDLIVHRLIRKYLVEKKFDASEKIIKKIAEVSSNCEKRAVECERDVTKMKCAEYMSKHINEEFDGFVSSVTSFGVFIKLLSGIEGLITLFNLNGQYIYDEKKMMLFSANGKIKLGDKMRIKVIKASKVDGNIDFIKVG